MKQFAQDRSLNKLSTDALTVQIGHAESPLSSYYGENLGRCGFVTVFVYDHITSTVGLSSRRAIFWYLSIHWYPTWKYSAEKSMKFGNWRSVIAITRMVWSPDRRSRSKSTNCSIHSPCKAFRNKFAALFRHFQHLDGTGHSRSFIDFVVCRFFVWPAIKEIASPHCACAWGNTANYKEGLSSCRNTVIHINNTL